MAFLKHLLPAWKKGIEDRSRANAAILSAIDKELTDAEKEAIKGKVILSLDSATGEWLDKYGSIFGVLRMDDELDDAYRSRIIKYILLKRGTIPAIKEAIRNFLQDYESEIDIYEPYNNIFYLNKSKLNGPDHLLGNYYTFAVIDIRISRPFPIGIVNVINEFKPAGVQARLTFKPGTREGATIYSLPLDGSEVGKIGTELTIANGWADGIRGHLNLTDRSRSEEDDSGVFTLNKSKLNSLDRLAGAFSVNNPAYNLASYSRHNLTFTTDTSIVEVANSTESVSQDFYTRTGKDDDLYASQTIDGSTVNYMYFTLDVSTYLRLNYEKYLREIKPDGIYTRDTYLQLFQEAYLQYSMKSLAPVENESKYIYQIFNIDTGAWDKLEGGTVGYKIVKGELPIENRESYLSNKGLVFIRLELPIIATKTIDGGSLTPGEEETVIIYDGGEYKQLSYSKGLDGGEYNSTFYARNVTGGFYKPLYSSENLRVLDGGELLEGKTIYTGTIDGNSGTNQNYIYEFHVHFLELGFRNNLGGRPTINTYIGEVSAKATLSETIMDGGSFETSSYTLYKSGGDFETTTYDKNLNGGNF